MTIDDVDMVWEIEKASFPKPWSREDFVKEMTVNKCARYIVAEDEGDVVGFAGISIVLDEGHMTNIAVNKNLRGRGIGSALMDALLRYSANLGVAYVTLEVRKSNLIAQSLYRSLGFISVGARKRYYEDNGEDALIMILDKLPPPDDDFSEEETVFE